MVQVFINDRAVEVPENFTVLQAAQKAGVRIPTLCYLKDINAIGACRVCLVEVKGARALQASCVLPVSEGMRVYTQTPQVLEARKSVLKLILSDHPKDCLTCIRNQSCELQRVCGELGIEEIPYEGRPRDIPADTGSPSIVRDPAKCILCRRCVSVCKQQNVHAIGTINRGYDTLVAPAFERSLNEGNCVNCGQCIASCPVGALYEKDSIEAVQRAIADPGKHVVFQTAPAVRVALGEEFGIPIGTRVTKKMVAAIRRLGADQVFDTDFAADLTIMEEGTELIGRIQNGGVLPMITSCSPGWIKFCEHNYPELLPHLSSCKSPHEMLGAVIKSWYAQRNNIDPKDIFVVSVMPCTAKKFEAQRGELAAVDGLPDVDAVLTTRELARMIKQAGLEFEALPDEEFDPILGDSTGAGVIFGASGGVMEAALRTVADILTGQDLPEFEYTAVRGLEKVKEATVQMGDLAVKVAVAHGTGAATELMERVKAGGSGYTFIEIMGCPGGCVSGGGQPIVSAQTRMQKDFRALRASAVYGEDKDLPVRKSHLNPSIQHLYADFLGEPGSHTAHELLHTHYIPRG